MTDGFATRAIHAGQTPDPRTGSIVPPIHQTSTFIQDGVGNLREGYEYGRSGNPTRTALEQQIAALERPRTRPRSRRGSRRRTRSCGCC